MSYRRGHLAQRASAIEDSRLPEPISRDDPGRVAELAVRRSTLKEFGLTDDSGGGTIPPYHLDLPAYEVVPQKIKDGWTRGSSGRVLGPDGKYVSKASDTPRLSYDGEDPGLLVEADSRTNHVPYSSDPSQWDLTAGPNGVSISSANSILKGETAQRVTPKAHPNDNIQVDAGFASGNDEVAYLLIEKGTSEEFLFDLRYNYSPIAFRSHQWRGVSKLDHYRVLTESGPNGGRLIQAIIGVDSDKSDNASGNLRAVKVRPDNADGEGSVYLHHAQIEEAPNASSPIVTQGSAVTRARDKYAVFSGGTPDWWNLEEGTLLFDVSIRQYASDTVFNDITLAAFDRDQSSNAIKVRNGYAEVNKYGLNDGDNVLNFGRPTPFSFDKVAVSFDPNEMRLSVNSVSASDKHNGTFASSDSLNLGAFGRGAFLHKKILYLPYALPEPTLNQITR